MRSAGGGTPRARHGDAASLDRAAPDRAILASASAAPAINRRVRVASTITTRVLAALSATDVAKARSQMGLRLSFHIVFAEPNPDQLPCPLAEASAAPA